MSVASFDATDNNDGFIRFIGYKDKEGTDGQGEVAFEIDIDKSQFIKTPIPIDVLPETVDDDVFNLLLWGGADLNPDVDDGEKHNNKT